MIAYPLVTSCSTGILVLMIDVSYVDRWNVWEHLFLLYPFARSVWGMVK
jgi:hypothetical protein